MSSEIVKTSADKGLLLGTIICRHCNCIIDVIDTNRVAFFYTQCNDVNCHNAGSSLNEDLD
jgi:SR1 protein